MKTLYTEPEFEIIRMGEDVICTSGSSCSVETPCDD